MTVLQEPAAAKPTGLTANFAEPVAVTEYRQQAGLPNEAAEITAQIHQLRRRIDLRILPLITITFLLSFLDRSNIGK
ncbi:hypothetical protein IWQ60_002634 [Tieghemiomyces parasiticus]|uniref:Uncharacterized protein n=1 Tax=Tieghemiomyces parasiticus TaxID=78921 RepID=A0A9W8ABV9_9FUNG|nr:hypothetical protein IWQ60_002634 [Tieghemiomyces parasiticus]